MFAISDELARAFLNSNVEEQEHGLLLKAKEFDKRKQSLVKKIYKTLSDENAGKLGYKYESVRSRSVSPHNRSNSR